MAKKPDRISEADLLIPTLRKLASQPNGRMSTSQLISELENSHGTVWRGC